MLIGSPARACAWGDERVTGRSLRPTGPSRAARPLAEPGHRLLQGHPPGWSPPGWSPPGWSPQGQPVGGEEVGLRGPAPYESCASGGIEHRMHRHGGASARGAALPRGPLHLPAQWARC